MPSSARLMIMMRREAGLSVVLAIQASIMFVVSPLAASGVLFPGALDAFRFALATAAVLTLTRDRFAAALIIATFVVSLSLSFDIRGLWRWAPPRPRSPAASGPRRSPPSGSIRSAGRRTARTAG